MGIFSTEEVNTGRQKEFDLLKGLFMVFIFLIHAFQATMTDMGQAVLCIWIFATMSGAAIFIFVMGFGVTYGSRSGPKELAAGGVRLVLYQYLSNLAYLTALIFPYPFVLKRISEDGAANLRMLIWVYFQNTNIFFIAGIFYLIFALLKKTGCRTFVYPLLGLISALLAPYLYAKPVNIPVLSYVATLLIGDASFVSFIPLYYLSYALIGVGAGYMYRHISDKRKFYLSVLPATLVIVIAWWIRAFLLYGNDIGLMGEVMEEGYAYPDILHVIASLAHIILFAAIIFLATDRKKKPGSKENPVTTQILRYSRHISKYYALHLLVYFMALGFNGYVPFEPWQCIFLMLIAIVMTELMVRSAEYIESKTEIRMTTLQIFINALPYWFMMFILVYRVYHLNRGTAVLSPQQFEMMTWWLSMAMICSTQILFLRNRKMMEEKSREQTLLNTARAIQNGIVPQNKEYKEGNIRISALAEPATSVGGDFYDIIPLNNGTVGIVMGDVSGKGIPAALVMAMIKTMIRDRLRSGMSPEEVLNVVNNEACSENPLGMFVTVFLGIIDSENGSVVYANAGHTHPVKTGEQTAFLEPDNGCVIGLFEDIGILKGEMVLNPGEGLLLYTDGVTEAINGKKEQYGEKRLLNICSKNISADTVNAVVKDVGEFAQGTKQFDDLTLLFVQHIHNPLNNK